MSAHDIPEHMRHLVGEISEKDLRRLIEMEQDAASQQPAAFPARTVSETDRHHTVLKAPSNGQGSAYIPLGENIEIKKLRPVEADKEEADPDRLRLPTPEDLMVAGEVGVLSVGMVLENSFFQLRGWKRTFNRQPAILRGIELITVSLLILGVIGFVAVREAKAYLKSQQGPFLENALVAPYDLEKQTVPASNAAASALLPGVIGKYTNTNQPITPNFPSSPTNLCLLGMNYTRDAIDAPNCQRNYGTTGVAYGRYVTSDYKNADVVVARFANESQAEGTMFDLLHHARQYGQVGNFSIGASGNVSYFYSSVRGWLSFTWSQGPWVFSVSGPNLQNVEDLIEQYQIPQTDPLRSSPGA